MVLLRGISFYFKIALEKVSRKDTLYQGTLIYVSV